ncbi:hypothetical protein INT45_010453 [Circinella minor]|uniref:Glycosyl transferase family 1 domain-containing protein n=1 Tax=Circinella minor TaxID=1195481 RepID=A0A8H7VME0_9FUNG|nr:hypothetical protein INT45_010453 [Circinella minor]
MSTAITTPTQTQTTDTEVTRERRDPCRQSIRRFSEYYIPQPIYLGVEIDISEKDPTICNYAISCHDGSYTVDYYDGQIKLKESTGHTQQEYIQEALTKLCDIIQAFSLAQHYKVHMIAYSAWNRDKNQQIPINQLDNDRNDRKKVKTDGPEQKILTYAWRQLDALPVTVKTHGPTLDERASAAVRKAVFWLSPVQPGNIPRSMVGYLHEVEVDLDYCIRIAGVEDYCETVSKDTWRVLKEMVKTFKQRDLQVSFFSSTPQGGGGFVMRPKPEIYAITKQKFHNVLQGIAQPDIELTEHDKQSFIEWTEDNATRFFLEEKGPIKKSDIFIIDDPQVTGLIPHIRKHAKNPNVPIIFRSHIELRADLLRMYPTGREAKTWEFLWNFIKETDVFIAHPVENFVPDQVPKEKVVLMPATTDPLDGLNKTMSGINMDYYQRIFNRMCVDQGSNEVDWERPYFVQIARFDPSKGIPDCLEAYSILRKKLDEMDYDPAYIPQLILCGHGSIDDPEGAVIYEDTHRRIDRMVDYASDISVARLPPSDQLLNTVLRNAHAALQLSHREGFEIKVTEATFKGIPVIAYQAGGIPLQIREGINGFLLPVGDVQGVADLMYQLLTQNDLHAKLKKQSTTCITEEFFTVTNAMNWLHLFIELTNKSVSRQQEVKNDEIGNYRKVYDLWRKKYNYDDSG